MNKHQLEYLTSKLRTAAAQAISDYTKEHQPVDHDKETVAKALEDAGFLPNHNSPYFDPFSTRKPSKRDGLSQAASWLTMPPTRQMQANRVAVDTFTKAIRSAERDAVDAANLGDSSDALAILAQFTESIKALAKDV